MFFLLKANFAPLCFSRKISNYFHRNGRYWIFTKAHGYDIRIQYTIYVPCWNNHKNIECDGRSRHTIDLSLLASNKAILSVLQRSQYCLKCLPQNEMLKYTESDVKQSAPLVLIGDNLVFKISSTERWLVIRSIEQWRINETKCWSQSQRCFHVDGAYLLRRFFWKFRVLLKYRKVHLIFPSVSTEN